MSLPKTPALVAECVLFDPTWRVLLITRGKEPFRGCYALPAGATKAEAAQSSRAPAVQSAYQLKSTSRWSYVTLSARRVKGDPFWKAVQPNGVPPGAQLKPDLVSSRFYTTCFTGVV